MQNSKEFRHSANDLVSAVLVTVVYFAFMLTIAFAPAAFSLPIAQGSVVSVGLVAGLAMTIFMVGFSAWYTHRRNRVEELERAAAARSASSTSATGAAS